MGSFIGSETFRVVMAVIAGLGLGFAAAVIALGGDPRLVRPRGHLPRSNGVQRRRLERSGWPMRHAWFYVWGRWPVGVLVGLIGVTLIAPMPGMLVGFLVMGGPTIFVRVKLARRRRQVQESVMESANTLLSLVNQGSSGLDAIVLLGRSYAPALIRPTWEALYQNIRRHGWAKALMIAQADLDDGLFDGLAATLLLNNDLGGSLIPPLRAMVDNLAMRDRLLRAVAASAFQQQVSAAMVPALGMGALLLLQLVQGPGGYMSVYDSFPGALVEVLCGVGFGLGYMATMWVNRSAPLARLTILPDQAAP